MGAPRFSCFLEVPADPAAGGDGLVVDPHAWLQLGSTIPAPLLHRARFRGSFLPGYPLVWREDPVTEALVPYWAPREWAAQLAQLRPGEPAPATLDPGAVGALCAAGVLAEPGARAAARRKRAADVAQSRERFAESGIATLDDVFPPGQIAALAAYYDELLGSGAVALGDEQCDLRFGIYDEAIARFFHDQATGVVSQIVGEPVKPSYTYTVAYEAGAELASHRDREQCEFSVSLLVDHRGGEPWPLWFETPDGEVAVRQSPGSGAVFRGRELAHRRDPLPDGRSVSVLLHYVPAGFTGSLR